MPSSAAAVKLHRFRLPVRYGVRVAAVERDGERYRLRAEAGEMEARHVVVATGASQVPRLPGFAASLPAGILQLQSGKYRRPELLPPGAVLVVHCPPLGVNDRTFSGHDGGSLAIKRVVEEFRPPLVLSGHIHEARGIVEKDGTIYLNPGAAKDGNSALLDIDHRIEPMLLDKVAD